MTSSTSPDLVDRGLQAMAFGRIGLGLGSLAAPSAMARAYGVPATHELDYMTRIFGARAVALGTAYLLSPPAQRRLLRRLCAGVDGADTLAALARVGRPDAPRRALAHAATLTGVYAAIGLAGLARDLRSRH